MYVNKLVINFKVFKVIWFLKKYYYEFKDINDQKIVDGVIDGIVVSVDDLYIEYFIKKEFDEFMIQSKGMYFGIGVIIELGENYIEVVILFEGFFVYKVGIKFGDKIIRVNGINLIVKDIDKVVSLMRGLKGMSVIVIILCNGSLKFIDFKIVRDEIKIKIVFFFILENNIGYIKIINFDENILQDFYNSYDKFKSFGCCGFIIDLRFNFGGFLEFVVDVVSNFFKKGQFIVYFKDRYNYKEYFKLYKNGDIVILFVVFINKYLVLVLEILVGCLKD